MPAEESNSVSDLFGEIGEPHQPAASGSPFKFLDPYGPEDRALFFGRDLEIADLYARFYRRRLVVVYGPSGSGKTSLIQCGLSTEIPPEDALFVPVRSAIDPFASVRQELTRRVRFPSDINETDLTALLREVKFATGKTPALVLDQFEELFLFQPPRGAPSLLRGPRRMAA
jgi:hypothetical protein